MAFELQFEVGFSSVRLLVSSRFLCVFALAAPLLGLVSALSVVFGEVWRELTPAVQEASGLTVEGLRAYRSYLEEEDRRRYSGWCWGGRGVWEWKDARECILHE
jgi:hypothetical protein